MYMEVRMKTRVSKNGTKFLINDQLVYGEISNVNPKSLGLLWNQRLIQGVFDDYKDRSRFNLFKVGVFDADTNTNALIASLPQWYDYGLRAITVGFQGGWPVDCVDVKDIENNPFGPDGKTLDKAYADRMNRIIQAADDIGMVVIVSLLYWAQSNRLTDGRAVINAVKTGCTFLKENKYTNVIVEVANEYNIPPFATHPIAFSSEGMTSLIQIAKEYSGGLLVGSSGGGIMADKEVVEESDVVIIHGNGATNGQYYNFIQKVKEWAPNSPILCNEDSPCCSRVDVAVDTETSWGYYNNYTKQIPPSDYSVTLGEDLFFARRIARVIGIPLNDLPFEEQFYLQGLEDWSSWNGLRAIRLAAEFPEKIKKVEFHQNNELIYTSYDEPFFLNQTTTWLGKPWVISSEDSEWKAVIHLSDSNLIEKVVKVKGVRS